MTNKELLQLQAGDLIELRPEHDMHAAILADPGLTLTEYKHKCEEGWGYREMGVVIERIPSKQAVHRPVVLIETAPVLDKGGIGPWWFIKAVCPDRGVAIFSIRAQCVKKVAVHSDA